MCRCISSNQLHRTLGVALKTAWFMSHRIREAMRDGALSPLGGAGKDVEVDETYIGRVQDMRKSRGPKMKVLSLVERTARFAPSWSSLSRAQSSRRSSRPTSIAKAGS